MISICMATFNGSKFIREQVDSILSQTYSDFELVIGDDFSSDDTVEILKEYQAKDKRIKLYNNSENIGFKKNFEKIINKATGDYISFCDQDDIWTKDHLEILINNIGNSDIVCADAMLIGSTGDSLNIRLSQCRQMNIKPDNSSLIFRHLLYGNYVQGTAMMATRSFINGCLPIPEIVKFHDYWFASMASISKGIIYVDKPILLYRQHQNNVTVNKKYSIFEKIRNTSSSEKEIFIDKIEYLGKFKEYCSNPKNIDLINEAIEYYNNLLCHKRIKALKYFKKNYSAIYLDKKNSSRYFLRLVKYLFFV